jgi:hypothetical protein
MIQKNGRTLNQNRVFVSEAVGYGKCRPAPAMQDARLQRTKFYARAAQLLEKYQIERNTEASLRDFQSMLRKACKYFHCDDSREYEAVCEYGTKVPRRRAM